MTFMRYLNTDTLTVQHKKYTLFEMTILKRTGV